MARDQLFAVCEKVFGNGVDAAHVAVLLGRDPHDIVVAQAEHVFAVQLPKAGKYFCVSSTASFSRVLFIGFFPLQKVPAGD